MVQGEPSGLCRDFLVSKYNFPPSQPLGFPKERATLPLVTPASPAHLCAGTFIGEPRSAGGGGVTALQGKEKEGDRASRFSAIGAALRRGGPPALQ